MYIYVDSCIYVNMNIKYIIQLKIFSSLTILEYIYIYIYITTNYTTKPVHYLTITTNYLIITITITYFLLLLVLLLSKIGGNISHFIALLIDSTRFSLVNAT